MKRFTLIALYILTIMQLSAQDNILSLIPEVKSGDHFYYMEDFANDPKNKCKRHLIVYSSNRNEETEPINQRFIAAFEKELSKATESDRYQIHSEKGDTLSYTLAYAGKNNKSIFNPMNLSIPFTFKLDVTDKSVQMRMHEKVDDYTYEPKDLTPINKLCEEIGKMKGVEKNEVLYATDGKKGHVLTCLHFNGLGECRATCYRIPIKEVETIKNKVKALCNSYVNTNQNYWISNDFDCIDIRFFDSTGQNYSVALKFNLLARSPDDQDYIYLLQVHSEGTYIPWDWYYIKKAKNEEVIFEDYTPESVKETFNRMRNVRK